MSEHTRDLIQWSLATLTSGLVLIGLATRYVLLPWLRDKLVDPLHETHRQVSENGHANAAPTIPDRLEDLAGQVAEATADHQRQSVDIRALTRVLDEHLRWADRWVSVTEKELDQLKQRIEGRDT